MCTARVFGILVLFAERTIKRQSPPSTCCRRPRGRPSLSFLLATRFVVVWSAPSPSSGSRLWPTRRHEACESPRDATFSFSRRVGFLSYRAFDLQPMPGRYARTELPAGKTARRGMHLSCSRILFQLQNVRSPPRFLSLSKADCRAALGTRCCSGSPRPLSFDAFVRILAAVLRLQNPASLAIDVVERVHARIASGSVQLFLDAKQLVVLRHTVAAAWGARLDLPGVACHG